MSTDPDLETGASSQITEQDTTRRMLRRQGIDQRLLLNDAQWSTYSTTICDLIAARFPQLAECRVGFCWPIKNEPDIRRLLRAWTMRGEPGFTALLPVVTSESAPLAFRRWIPGAPMAVDRYGIPVPADGDFETPEALLIPVNAFDARGYRIGYGGGFFDRTIATLKPRPLCIGLGFELARVDSTLPKAHDVRLDAMVTEIGVFDSVG